MNLKQERNEQWGSSENRGWDRWRITTFLEVIEAKAGRAIIAQGKTKDADSTTLEKARKDLIDSLEDLINYTNKCLEKINQDNTSMFIAGESPEEVAKANKNYDSLSINRK